MPSLREVNSQIQRLKIANAWLVQSEVRQLPTILEEGEQIISAIQGTWNRQNALLVATRSRLIFVYKGMTRLAVKDLAFDQITSVEFEAGWAFGEITIHSAGHKAKITKLTAAETQPFAEMVRNSSSAAASGSIAPINRPNVSEMEVGTNPQPSQQMLDVAEAPNTVQSSMPPTAATNATVDQSRGSTNESTEHKRSFEASAQRKVSVLLTIGIAVLPALFVWFLLRQGHSTTARLFGFGWAGLLLLVSVSTVDTAPHSSLPQTISSGVDASRQSNADVSPDPLTPWPEEGDGVRVTRAGFERRNLVWPLTVNSAIIGCRRPELLWVEANGTRYGINGMGQIHLRLDRFDDIWATDSSFPSVSGGDKMRLSPSDLMAEARKLCG